jgi:hypothetical protein
MRAASAALPRPFFMARIAPKTCDTTSVHLSMPSGVHATRTSKIE